MKNTSGVFVIFWLFRVSLPLKKHFEFIQLTRECIQVAIFLTRFNRSYLFGRGLGISQDSFNITSLLGKICIIMTQWRNLTAILKIWLEEFL